MRTIKILIVDDDQDLVAALPDQIQATLRDLNVMAEIQCMRSINEFLQDGTEDRPELILLDQHWMEMRPDELLERTARKYGGSKIVVFTGKPLDAPLILNCARFGVADYIQKGSTTPEALAKRIHLIALDDALCVDKLRLLSGSQKQLLQDGDSGPSRTGFRGESEQHSGLKANRIPVVNRTSIPV